MRIEYVEHSIANNFGSHIEVNKYLKDYPELLEPILKHELEHSEKAWSLHDLKLDLFSNTHIDYWQLFKFMLKHPKSFYQLLPIMYYPKKGFSIDINLIIMFITMFLVFSLTIYFGVKYL